MGKGFGVLRSGSGNSSSKIVGCAVTPLAEEGMSSEAVADPNREGQVLTVRDGTSTVSHARPVYARTDDSVFRYWGVCESRWYCRQRRRYCLAIFSRRYRCVQSTADHHPHRHARVLTHNIHMTSYSFRQPLHSVGTSARQSFCLGANKLSRGGFVDNTNPAVNLLERTAGSQTSDTDFLALSCSCNDSRASRISDTLLINYPAIEPSAVVRPD